MQSPSSTSTGCSTRVNEEETAKGDKTRKVIRVKKDGFKVAGGDIEFVGDESALLIYLLLTHVSLLNISYQTRRYGRLRLVHLCKCVNMREARVYHQNAATRVMFGSPAHCE